MKVSSRARYGLRALFDIAYHNRGRPTQVQDIARRQEVPPRYLVQVMGRLRDAGLVRSQRGPKGGFVLARDPEAITLGDVVRAADGPIHLAEPAPDPGPERAPEPWGALDEAVSRLLDARTLGSLCAQAEAEGRPRAGEQDRLMYFI